MYTVEPYVYTVEPDMYTVELCSAIKKVKRSLSENGMGSSRKEKGRSRCWGEHVKHT